MDAPAKMALVTKIELVGLTLAILGTACWAVCFWWMHRISVRQETMLRELHEVIARIEALAKEEHALIQEVHPAVEKIQDSVENVAEAVSEQESGRGA